MGRDSSVGIATRYRLDGPGIESRVGGSFFAPVQTGPGAHPASYTMGTGSFLGVKRPGRGVENPSIAEVRERVELYLYSPFWAFVACYRVIYLYFYFTVRWFYTHRFSIIPRSRPVLPTYALSPSVTNQTLRKRMRKCVRSPVQGHAPVSEPITHPALCKHREVIAPPTPRTATVTYFRN